MLLIPVMRTLLLGKTVLLGKQPLPYNKAFIDLISKSEATYPNAARVVHPVRTAPMVLLLQTHLASLHAIQPLLDERQNDVRSKHLHAVLTCSVDEVGLHIRKDSLALLHAVFYCLQSSWQL